jgi:hypothetical protein
LCIFRTVLDVVGNDGNVTEIEGSINLVHEVQGSRLFRGKTLITMCTRYFKSLALKT